MKRILLVMPNYYGFDEVVNDVLTKYSNCEVHFINYDVGFKYVNLFQRLKNFYSKVILKKNLKPQFKEKYFLDLVKSFDHFDYVIANRPDILPVSLLNELKTKSNNKILLLWDSLEKVPIAHSIIGYFDKVFSFDINDCKNFKFSKIENFHFESNSSSRAVEVGHDTYDAVFLGTVDKRIDDLKIILDYLKSKNKLVRAYLHIPKERNLVYKEDITILKKIVPFKYSHSFIRNCKIIIDLAHDNQTGLSFRVFEAMKFQKKLITTNRNIKNFDFYRSENIYIVDNINEINISADFFESPYCPLPQDIYDKYSAKSWVEKIMSND